MDPILWLAADCGCGGNEESKPIKFTSYIFLWYISQLLLAFTKFRRLNKTQTGPKMEEGHQHSSHATTVGLTLTCR
jgi:hypothetical protein